MSTIKSVGYSFGVGDTFGRKASALSLKSLFFIYALLHHIVHEFVVPWYISKVRADVLSALIATASAAYQKLHLVMMQATVHDPYIRTGRP